MNIRKNFLWGGLCLVLVMAATQPLFAQPLNRGRMDPFIDASEPGLVIIQVLSDSPAEKAGLRRGDILLKMEGQDIQSEHDVYSVLEERKAGDTINLTIQRGDETQLTALQIEDRLFRTQLGLIFAPNYGGVFQSPTWLQDARLRIGAVIMEVVPDSPASDAQLKEGDMIIAVNGTEIDPDNPLDEVIHGFKPGDDVTISIMRGEVEMEVPVKLMESEEGKAFLGISFYPFPAGFFRMEQILPRMRERFDSFRGNPRRETEPEKEEDASSE